jgi:hypothetical protein
MNIGGIEKEMDKKNVKCIRRKMKNCQFLERESEISGKKSDISESKSQHCEKEFKTSFFEFLLQGYCSTRKPRVKSIASF